MKTSDLIWQETQHQDLIKLVQRIQLHPEIGVEIFRQLNDYVDHHFSLEEKYMEVSKYPADKKEIHIRAHRGFEKKMRDLSSSPFLLNQGMVDSQFRRKLIDFLNQWLTGHVMGLDKELEAHIKETKIQ